MPRGVMSLVGLGVIGIDSHPAHSCMKAQLVVMVTNELDHARWASGLSHMFAPAIPATPEPNDVS